MKKSILTPAIIICTMILSPANANAAFWLDIVKEFVSGGIKTIVMPKSAKGLNAIADSKKATATGSGQATKANAQPSPEEIFDALSRLNEVCAQKLNEHIPCAVGTGENFSIGDAREEAVDNAIVGLAKSMGTLVEAESKLDKTKSKDPDGVLKVANSYIQEAKLTTKQLVSGAQQYLSYTYIDEKLSEVNNQKVYVTTVVMVMDSQLFGKALENIAKDKPLSEELINESKKGIISIVRNAIKKI